MGIILFLVDTSASMNQKTYLGASYLDVAKVAIETFLKYRSREPNSRYDRYMLVSFDEPPNCIKAGWKTSNAGFISQLKNLQASSLSTFGQSLREAFDLLNLYRLHTSIDHYGQGRNPFFLESAVVIAFTDGGKLTHPLSIEHELSIPASSSPLEGSELTNQPFRWDQRLFTVLLRMPGIGEERNMTASEIGADNGYLLGEASITALCEMTGGKSYVVANQKSLAQSMESLTQKLQPGVVINFQKIGGTTPLNEEDEEMEVNGCAHNGKINGPTENDHKMKSPPNGEDEAGKPSSTAWHNTRKMIYVKTTNISPVWPMPESFWPETHIITLPPRDVHPIVWFETTDVTPILVEKFPFDKYELEPSPLTQYILGKRNSNLCWQVFIGNSGKQEGLTYPFGYLKPSNSLAHVTLFVMPFNYSVLLPLAEELLNIRLRPGLQWRQKFSEYISTVPSYYAQPLRKAFNMMGASSNIITESFDGQMSYSISNYLRKLKKQAKLESERVLQNISKSILTEASRRSNSMVDLGDGISLAIGSTLKDEGRTSQSFRNPYDISRSGLLGQLSRMRSNFLRVSHITTPNYIDEVMRHQIPIGQMGNYQEHLKKVNPLREIDEVGGLRTQLFGNPYKLERSADKAGVLADEHMVEMNRKSDSRGSGRRKMRLFSLSKSVTPPPSTTNRYVTATSNSSTPLITSLNPPSPEVSSGIVDAARLAKSSENTSRELATPVTKESSTLAKGEALKQQSLSVPTNKELPATALNSHLEPFKSSFLPEEKTNHLSVQSSLNKKRERSPSPTAHFNSKRPYVLGEGASSRLNAASSQVLISRGSAQGKAPSPVPSGGLTGSGGRSGKMEGPVAMSSASRVLTEEILRQEGQENGKLKVLIIKEVRKQGKKYEMIFQHLDGVRGSVETKDLFVGDIIKEACKFKRKKLVQELEVWRTNIRTGTNSHLNSAKKAKLLPPPPPPVKR